MQYQETYEQFMKRVFDDPYTMYNSPGWDTILPKLVGDAKQEAWDHLMTALEKKDQRAIQGFCYLEPLKALPYIRPLLTKKGDPLYWEALKFLNEFDDEADKDHLTDLLMEYLNSDDVNDQIPAARVARYFPRDDVIARLRNLNQRTENKNVRMLSRESLEEINKNECRKDSP